MTTPVSAATPASAMKPTATATDMLKPSHHISQRPPTSANGNDSITISVSGDRLRIAAEIARVAQIDAVTLSTFYSRRNRLAAKGRRNGVLYVADHEAVAGKRFPVRCDVQIIASDDPFRVSARCARHRLD